MQHFFLDILPQYLQFLKRCFHSNMVRITEQLIRKKSEHNELIIGTLEELSLHQEDIEKIEFIQNWCRDLKILLMHNNLISRIENLHKLKKLEYLNLSLNNIERIENLEQLESLTKFDLTLNFIGDLRSVENLRDNYNLRELILTGNYCCGYTGYRSFVIATLPQLERLDGVEITRMDRIVANREYDQCLRTILQQQAEQQIKRDEQKLRVRMEQERMAKENVGLTVDEINEKFWKQTSEHCPETRIEMSNQHRKTEHKDVKPEKHKPKRRLFADCGRPYNLNEAKLKFHFEDLRDHYSLELHVYKYLETSLINVDVQPNYVRATIKEKTFQLALPDEVNITESSTKRSLATGHLLIKMPKLKYDRHDETTIIDSNAINATTKPAPTDKLSDKRTNNLAVIDYKQIVKQNSRSTGTNDDVFDESEIPPLC